MTLPLPVFFIFAFFMGSLPNAYLAGRLLKNIDIRQHGSGNVGATNVFRVLGKGPGFAVFFLDFVKGALPVALFLSFFPEALHRELLALGVGLAAVLGHMFTPFLGFRGGKGVAAGAGAVCASFPPLFAVTLAVWLLTFFFFRIVSVSSILAVSALFISGLLTRQPPEIVAAFFGMLLLVLWSHRSNLKKLKAGQEHRWN